MKNQEPPTVTYDDRVNTTLAGLMEGKTREVLAEGFGLGGWKSLDIYMRRKGFVWDGSNNTYIPATNKADTILEELSSNTPVKADMIIRRFAEMGTDSEPRAIATEFGFSDHRELGEYMESKQLFWDSNKNNYVVMVGTPDHQMLEETTPGDDVFIPRANNGESRPMNLELLQPYLPIFQMLLENKERLTTLLMPQSDGRIPRYAVPGMAKTKSTFMSSLLARLMEEFSEVKNISQRDIVETALIEYFKRYGYQREVEKLLGKV